METLDVIVRLGGAAVAALWAIGLAWLAWMWASGDRRKPPRRGPRRWQVGDLPSAERKHWRRQ